jgi:septal ring factor EnvC (AmiA/AmiB activator)
LGLSLPAPAAEKDAGAKEQELNRVRGRISELKGELDSARGQHADLHQELQELEQKVGQLARHLRVLAGSLSRQRERLAGLQEKRQEQEAKLAVHREALAKQIRSAYAMGRQEQIKILLNQQDPAIVSRVMVYYDYFNRARTERLALIAGLLERLREIETEVALEEARLQELQTRELEQQAQLEQVRATRHEVIASLDAEIRGKGQELAGLKKNERQLQALMERLQDERLVPPPAETVSHQPFRSLKGNLPWPSKGRLAALFGTEKRGGMLWDGVLISAPEGREVRAVHHGRVAFADWLRGFGLLLIIDHGDGYMSLYGHNQSLFKEAGEWVEQGEPVALVGSSGGRLDAGVYFGIRHQGRPVNPKAWCLRAKGGKVGLWQNSRAHGAPNIGAIPAEESTAG